MDHRLYYIVANWEKVPGWKRFILVLPFRLAAIRNQLESFFLSFRVDDKANKT